MNKIIMGVLIILPSISFSAIRAPSSSNITSPIQTRTINLSPDLFKDIYNNKYKEGDLKKIGIEDYSFFEDFQKYIKRPKHDSLNEDLKKQYQENFQILKKCYVKPQDNLQDIMIVMGKFINAYADIVYGKEIISYDQEVQDYDRILSKTQMNKSANPEECLKAREFFENQLM